MRIYYELEDFMSQQDLVDSQLWLLFIVLLKKCNEQSSISDAVRCNGTVGLWVAAFRPVPAFILINYRCFQ